MQVIRAILFVIFWPFLRRWGYGMTVKQAAVLTWWVHLPMPQPPLVPCHLLESVNGAN